MADLAITDAKLAGKTLGDTHSDRHPDPTLQFQLEPGVEADDSGGNSPPLWKNGGPSPSRPLLGRHRRLRSDSRTEAIARGQWELMEMVKNMPESSYELSLKDLVESNREIDGDGSVGENQGVDPQQRAAARSTRSSPEERRKISGEGKIGGFDNRGVILNTGFPFSARGPKRKVAVVKNHGDGRVSPKCIS
ncbi:hypothetical protein STAS_14112 [Striga asiatica]|uniref:Uncharacterized protein n=1 Tax=Striga asiatica TaxID=4170 RepID=A0A5A7PY77_STRAF|nr:hypothetical protein STAS_14112 [Striga asiatica]